MSWAKRGVGKARRLWSLARKGDTRAALKSARKSLWSTEEANGFRRDLSKPFNPPQASIELRIRPLEPRDLPYLLSPAAGDKAVQLVRQQRLVDARIPTCWVAVDDDDLPCYMQWVIGPESNDLMGRTFGTEFPPVADDEILLEGAFTPARYRSQRIGGEAVTLIANTAHPTARWALTFISTRSIAPSKMAAIGFEVVTLRRSRWRLLRHTTTFEPVPVTVSSRL